MIRIRLNQADVHRLTLLTQKFQKVKRRWYVESAKIILRDIAQRIEGHLTLDGGPQQENDPTSDYARRKQANLGHLVPLKAYQRRFLEGWTVVEQPNGVSIEAPESLEPIIPNLIERGYDPPIGMSAEAWLEMQQLFHDLFDEGMR